MQYLGSTYTNKLFVVYLKFKFIWESCVLSGNPKYFKLSEFYCNSTGE